MYKCEKITGKTVKIKEKRRRGYGKDGVWGTGSIFVWSGNALCCIYKKLGAHPVTQNGKSGTYFAVWAPNAEDVSVVGEFNDWDPERHPMKKTGPIGVWETFVAGAKVGDLYKFCIRAMDGRLLYKADPYASWSEMRPGNASRIADITGFKWGDAAWMKKRKETDPRRAALSIYEVHPGSWKKHPASEADPDGFYS